MTFIQNCELSGAGAHFQKCRVHVCLVNLAACINHVIKQQWEKLSKRNLGTLGVKSSLCYIFITNRAFWIRYFLVNEHFLLFSVKSLDNDCLPRCKSAFKVVFIPFHVNANLGSASKNKLIFFYSTTAYLANLFISL